MAGVGAKGLSPELCPGACSMDLERERVVNFDPGLTEHAGAAGARCVKQFKVQSTKLRNFPVWCVSRV